MAAPGFHHSNGSSNGHAHAHPGMPSLDHDHIRGRANFDLDRSRLSMSPAMLWSLLVGSVSVAAVIVGIVYQTNNRIGGVEAGIVELRDELRFDREHTQTKQQALVDCLLHERANKGWTCTLATAARAPDQPPRKEKRKQATAQPPGSNSLLQWPWATQALAGDGK